MNQILTYVGMALFALALLVGTTFAAVVPSYEWAQLEGQAIAKTLGEGKEVAVAIAGDDLKKATEIAKDLSFGLESAGLKVMVRKDGVPPNARYLVQGLVKIEEGKPDVAKLRVRDLRDRSKDQLGTLLYESSGVFKPDFSSKLTPWLVCAILASLGLIVWRVGVSRAAKAAADDTDSSDENPFKILEALQEPLNKLAEDLIGLDEHATCDRVDELLEGFVLPFAEVRRKVIDRLGMTKGSEILVVVAYGERMLNRTWSAASDGHLPEARSVFPEAKDAFEEAARLASEA